MKKLTYAATGPSYEDMDPFKILSQAAARETANNFQYFGHQQFREFEASRGESAYLIETDDSYLAHVEEGLGTKNLVADAMFALTGKSYYNHIAQDTVAMIVNDMATVGAAPLSVAMHLAVWSSDWFQYEKRSHDLINGWKHACDLARCTWGGGETSTLKGALASGASVLSGSAMGIIRPKKRLINCRIQHGDSIVLIESSGIHANGLSMARKIAETLSDGYGTKLVNGRTYGETLLDPTHIYVGLVQNCLDIGVDIHYAANITGHGWRKLMRASEPFTYVISLLPKQLPIFEFIQKHGPVDDGEAYGNLNMGAGFALYVPFRDTEKVLNMAKHNKFGALVAGHIEKGEKKVIIRPKDLEYAGKTLAVR